MQQRKLLAVAAGLALMLAVGERVSAQNEAPFTIRYPPDGATVREDVRVRVPLASIPEGGYVAFKIDGQFRVALAPSDEQRKKRGRWFEYTWDTKVPMRVGRSNKEETPKDGEHEISASLYAPRENGGSVLKQTSSVRVRLANKVQGDPGAIRLRYRYIDGSASTYNRNGSTAVVSGLTQGAQGTEDQEMVAQKSQLLFAVEDRYANGQAIVRNRLTRLTVRQAGQETVYPQQMLPKSLYQQVDAQGRVVYQNETPSYDQFAQLGVPVSTTLELPLLPGNAVRIGDTWNTPNVSLDIPGTPPDKQPKETVKSTLEALEWEGGYPTAKIHQTFKGRPRNAKSIIFGTVEVESPEINFERDIYIAYRSGTLVKVTRKLEVTGKTAQAMTAMTGPPGLGGGPMMPGGMTAPGGMSMPGGMMAPGGMPGPGGYLGPPSGMMGPGAPGTSSSGMMGGGPPGGYLGPPSGMMGGAPGMPGMGRRGRQGRSGRLGGMMGPGGMMGSGSMMPPAGMMGGRMGGGPRMGMGGTQQGSQQITLKSTVVTELTR